MQQPLPRLFTLVSRTGKAIAPAVYGLETFLPKNQANFFSFGGEIKLWEIRTILVPDTVARAPSAEELQDPRNFSPADLHSEGQRAIYNWYLGQAAGGGIPMRRNFEPIDFPIFLPFLVLVDVEEAPRRYRVRLVGTKVVDARGRDGTGDYYDEVDGANLAIKRIEDIIESREPRFETDVPMTWSPKNFKIYSVLSIPLSSDGAKVDKIMYCLDFE
ncbi:MAG: hypothetical protein VCE74_16365 [Alphaproteobacteria bacterium]